MYIASLGPVLVMKVYITVLVIGKREGNNYILYCINLYEKKHTYVLL